MDENVHFLSVLEKNRKQSKMRENSKRKKIANEIIKMTRAAVNDFPVVILSLAHLKLFVAMSLLSFDKC